MKMIACDDCSEYYHTICIGMNAECFQESVDAADEDDLWYCKG